MNARKMAGLLGLLALLFAFQQPAASDLVRKEVEERVEVFRREQWKYCKQRALKQASEQVDSLIIEWAKSNRDTLGRPPRPVKPLPPEPLAPKDSTPVKPLFD